MLKIIFSSNWEFFFFKLGKMSPKLHWEWGLISAPETPEKNPWPLPKVAKTIPENCYISECFVHTVFLNVNFIKK